MNDAQTQSTSATFNRLRWLSNSAVASSSSSSSMYMMSPQRAWCQTSELDYCPAVISVMSLVIVVSFVTIVYLCAKTSFDWTTSSSYCMCCWPLITKLVGDGDEETASRRRHELRRQLFRRHQQSLLQHQQQQMSNTSSNYINDVVSLQSINHLVGSSNELVDEQRPTSQPQSSQPHRTSRSSRAIWWITGGFASTSPISNKYADTTATDTALVAPPTYDESQQHQQHRFMRTNRPQIVRKHPKITATENAAFSMESNVDTATSSGAVVVSSGAQFPAYRCLSLTTTPSTSRGGCDLILNAAQNHRVSDFIDCLSTIGVDEVPPPYEAVIVGETTRSSQRNTTRPSAAVNSFNSSLSARLANYSFRSAREFQI